MRRNGLKRPAGDLYFLCGRTLVIEPQQVRQHALVHLDATRVQGMFDGQRLARARVGPDVRPFLAPFARRVGRGVGGQHGAVKRLVGELQLVGRSLYRLVRVRFFNRASFAAAAMVADCGTWALLASFRIGF